ncbi:MAG: DNA alkylation repair protein [Chlorobium sp.]|nr:DNA alkylation repair protein [Chlorobium sp.]
MSVTASMIIKNLEALSNPEAALFAQRYFKTGPGEYAEGDIFRGIRVPVLRKMVPSLDGTPLPEVIRLLESVFHEDRLLALFLLIRRFSKGDESVRQQIHEIYLAHTRFINNWDLVDNSAQYLVGAFLCLRDRSLLYQLAASQSLWERRIAITATFHFIRKGEFEDTLALAELLLDDPQELLHKATGWMLREVGKRDLPTLESFLQLHHPRMPRVMLRYAIERFPEERRLLYLKGLV